MKPEQSVSKREYKSVKRRAIVRGNTQMETNKNY